MTTPLNLAIIDGDGIGPEVTAESLRVLEALAKTYDLDVQQTFFDYGQRSWARQGEVITDAQLEELKNYDAIFFGAVGHPDVPPGVIERGLLLKMRFALDQYINLRPVKLLEGLDTPLANRTAADIDMVVVRENTEGLYAGSGGIARKGTEHEVATQEMLGTAYGIERCLRYAFELAQTRERKHLTLVHKTNVLTFVGDLWMRTFNRLKAEFTDVETAYHHVDACCMYMTTNPGVYDVVVTGNMFGDIITDLGAAIAGGMGIATSGNINPSGNSVSMYEPVHGSAPDIAGQQIASPLASMLALAMLLEQTGQQQQAPALIRAGKHLEETIAKITPSFTGKGIDRSGYSTAEVSQMVLDAL